MFLLLWGLGVGCQGLYDAGRTRVFLYHACVVERWGSMLVDLDDVVLWRGAPFEEAGVALRRRAQVYEEVCDDLKRLLREDFQGAASEAEARARRVLIDDAEDIQRVYEQASSRFLDIAQAIDELVVRARNIEADAQPFPIVGCPTDANCRIPTGSIARTDVMLERACIHDAEAIVIQIRGVYSLLAGLGQLAGGPVSSIVEHGVNRPRSGWNAHEVNDWWTALSVQEQERIIQEHPEWIGNLAGIPSLVRHRANVARIDSLLAELEEEIRKQEKEGVRGHLKDEHVSYLLMLHSKRRDLLSVKRKFSGDYDPYYTLVSLDVWSGDHLQASVGLGDIDRAKHVMVHTPGMTSTVESTLMGEGEEWGSGVVDMENVLDLGNKQGRHGKNDPFVAGIVHLNYDAPRWSETPTIDSVALPFRAEDGGDSAALMLEGVQATHEGDPHLVNSGHSYGSVAAGHAMGGTMVADDFTAMGSPGLMAVNNESLRAMPGHVYIGKAVADPVADLGAFVGDPSEVPAFQHWSTREWVGPDGVEYEGSLGHSEYMKENSTSAYNLASILIGEGIAAPGVKP